MTILARLTGRVSYLLLCAHSPLMLLHSQCGRASCVGRVHERGGRTLSATDTGETLRISTGAGGEREQGASKINPPTSESVYIVVSIAQIASHIDCIDTIFNPFSQSLRASRLRKGHHLLLYTAGVCSIVTDRSTRPNLAFGPTCSSPNDVRSCPNIREALLTPRPQTRATTLPSSPTSPRARHPGRARRGGGEAAPTT